MTFHSGEQNKLENITKNIEREIVWPIENHPPELWHIKTKSETPQELMWDPTEKKTFWYHETVVISPHAKKSKIDRLQKQIDELHRFPGKEPFD
jgi:hypothetical protein